MDNFQDVGWQERARMVLAHGAAELEGGLVVVSDGAVGRQLHGRVGVQPDESG